MEFQIICRLFGVPLMPKKSVPPTTCLEFLGIQIDTVAMEFGLPMTKAKDLTKGKDLTKIQASYDQRIFPVLVALELWGSQFCDKRILLPSDNRGVIYVINCLVSKSLLFCAILFLNNLSFYLA